MAVHFCFWPKADLPNALMHLCLEGRADMQKTSALV
jgi:hypothetical protein